MSNELEALDRICEHLDLDDAYFYSKNGEKADYKIIKTALKEKEQQDEIIKIIKEIISFKASEPEFEMDEDDSVRSIIGRVYLELKRAITNNERELFRNWVLETCFPKELKVLKIIEEKQINIAALLELDSLQQYNDYCAMVGGCKKLTQEEFDLVKETM